MNTDLNTALQSLIGSMYIRYKGCLIERVGKEFRVMNKNYPTLYLAKKKIDLMFNDLKNSVK